MDSQYLDQLTQVEIQCGDRVAITTGEYQGKTGTVIKIRRGDALVQSPKGGKRWIMIDALCAFPDLPILPVLQPVSEDQGLSEAEKQKSSDTACPATSVGRSWRTAYDYRSHGATYYRFAWGKGDRREGCLHIPGGNAKSSVARQRFAQVEAWIAQGVATERIAEAILGWRVNCHAKLAPHTGEPPQR